MPEWIRCSDRLPESGQKVFYFGILGLWRGWYEKQELDELAGKISPHTFYGTQGCCDTDEVTHWMEDIRDDGYVPLPPGYVGAAALLRRIADGEYRYTADDYEQQRLASRLEREAEVLLDGHREFV